MNLVDEFRRCWLIIIFGCLLFIVGTGILFWNEGRAVRKILTLDEALNDAVTLVNPEDDIENIYEGRLVHLSGSIVMGEPLTEIDYNIQVLAVKLKRRVQMYQWVEETVEHNFGETVASFEAQDRTYYYSMEWRDNLIDSRRFYIQTGHENPTQFPVESQTQVAETVTIGKYELGNQVKEKVKDFMDLTSDSRPEDQSNIRLHSGLYYHTNDVFNPEIGDLRIQFSFAGLEGDLYTVVGKLERGRIVPYQTSHKSEILLVYRGELTLKEAIKSEHHAERLTTWAFRFLGWVLLYFGGTCTATLLHIFLSRLYFLSHLAPELPSISGNFIISFSLALVVTSIAWVLHRPYIGAGLLFAAASPFLYCARSAASAGAQRLVSNEF